MGESGLCVRFPQQDKKDTLAAMQNRRVRAMMYFGWRHGVSRTRSLPVFLRIAAVSLIAVSAGGCHERLAQKDAYFSSSSATLSRVGAERERLMAYHQALQAVQLRCAARGSAAEPSGVGPAGRPALAGVPGRQDELCAAQGTHAAQGGVSNAYRRWVEDRVRPLPEPSDSASSVGDGS